MTMSEAAAGGRVGTSGSGRPSLDDRYTQASGRILVSGTQALVRLPMLQRERDLAAGLNTAGFVSGYRGSPLAGFDREMARARPHLEAHHVRFQPGLNEDLAATAVWGTQQTALFPGARYDGVFALWYGKGPGVDRSLDVIRHANAAGTNPNGGVLLLVGDDHGAASSTVAHQSEHNLISAMVPLLSPAGVGEYIDYGLMGFAMSRFSGAWVGFKCQTEVVECTATVTLDPTRPAIVMPGAAGDFALRWPDGPHAMEPRLEQKLAAVQAFARANSIDRPLWAGRPGRARLGIVSTGKSWLDLMGALAALGIDEARAGTLGLRLYKVGLVWPLEPEGLMRFAGEVETLLVVEEKRPVIEDQVKSLLYAAPADRRPRVLGKHGPDGAPLLPSAGEIGWGVVARAILRVLGEAADPALQERAAALSPFLAPAPIDTPALRRDPYFCSGCPHSVSTRVPDGSRASTGIGCHMMIIGVEERKTATFTQMGGEGASWIGLSPFTDEEHIFVNMGDGTYFHSGVLAIRAAIAARVNATYKILYNDAVAMTGGQRHDGEVTVPGIVAQMIAEGAARVAVVAEDPDRWFGALPAGVSVSHRDDLDAVQRDLREIPGVTVLVYDQVCAAEKRRRRKRGTMEASPRRAVINPLVCEGCGHCSAVSNCISVEPLETEFGRKRRINQSSCNTDLSCLKGFCPSFVTVEGGRLRRPAPRPGGPEAALPEPARPPLGDGPYNILLAGIGGTGVITVSAILSMAAHLDGLAVQTLDRTGLAQKNGAVLSHLRLAPSPDSLSSVRIGPGESDLVLGFDLVVAAGREVLSTVAAGRTALVLDDHVAPTAAFVRDTTIDFRQEAMLRALRKALGGEPVRLHAGRLGTALLGDAIAANMVLLGHAWQRGLVPIGLAALMDAIALNGAGVSMNTAAFQWGRLSAVDPAAVEAAAGTQDDAAATAPATLDDLVARRAAFLADYQDDAYAARYRRLVERARAAEAAAGGDGRLAEAVARNAFKLMAVKDEYEVARLHRDPSFRRSLEKQFEGDYRVHHHLAPPLLSRRIDPRTGMPAKIGVPGWLAGPAFAVLAKLKGLRGTTLDPFGRTQERRDERRLIAEYEATIEALCAGLVPQGLERALAIAALPDEVRGFGPIKAAAIRRYDAERARLLAEAGAEGRVATPMHAAE